MPEMLVTRRVNPTGTSKVNVIQLPADREGVAKFVGIYNAGTADVVLIIYEGDDIVDEILVAAGERKEMTGDSIYKFNEGKTISVALNTSGDVRVTMTIQIR